MVNSRISPTCEPSQHQEPLAWCLHSLQSRPWWNAGLEQEQVQGMLDEQLRTDSDATQGLQVASSSSGTEESFSARCNVSRRRSGVQQRAISPMQSQ